MRLIAAVVSLLTLTMVSVSGSQRRSRQAATLTIVVQINNQDPKRLNESVIAGAVAEANLLWAPYGVFLLRAAPDALEPSLTVEIQEAPLVSSPRAALLTPLGAITFAIDGEPQDAVRISLSSILDLLNATWYGAPFSQRPIVWREMILSRVLGRVLAHEIGHFVLKFPAHAAKGLMAANHSADEFSESHASHFSLTPLLEFRLRQIFDRARDRGVLRLPDARLP
jgi:hypothetical protein